MPIPYEHFVVITMVKINLLYILFLLGGIFNRTVNHWAIMKKGKLNPKEGLIRSGPSLSDISFSESSTFRILTDDPGNVYFYFLSTLFNNLTAKRKVLYICTEWRYVAMLLNRKSAMHLLPNPKDNASLCVIFIFRL